MAFCINNDELLRYFLLLYHIKHMQRIGTARKGQPSNRKRAERYSCHGHCRCRAVKDQSKSLSKGRHSNKMDNCFSLGSVRASKISQIVNSKYIEDI